MGTPPAITPLLKATPFLSACLALTLAACAEGGEEPSAPSAVASIVITPSSPTLVSIGETVQLVASAAAAGNTSVSGTTFDWTSSDPAVASVNASGVVTSVSNGSITITAASDGISGTASVAVDQQGAQLAFTVEPTTVDVSVPITPGIEVVILDALGTLVGDATDAVAMVIGAGAPGGTLLGTTSVNAIGGTATFPDLAIDAAGRDYALVASSGNLTSANGSPFNVLSGLPAAAVRITSGGVSIAGIGSTHDFQLVADDQNGDPTSPPSSTWSSLNPDVATIASLDTVTGRVTAHRDGQVTIVADAGGLVDDALLTVFVPGPAGVATWSWGDFNSNALTDVWLNAPNDVWVVGWSGTVLHYDGASWNDVTPGLVTTDLFGVWASGPADVWVVGRGPTLLHFDGVAWSDDADAIFSSTLADVWGSASNDVWIVGSTAFGAATLFHFDGTAWSDLGSALPDTTDGLSGVWGSGPNDVWAVGRTGAVFHFDGAVWSDVAPGGLVSDVRDIFGSSSSDVWVVADSVAWQYDGTQWIDRTAGITVTDLQRIRTGWTNGPGSVWIITINSTFVWHHNGTSWVRVLVPWDINGGQAISGSGAGDVWAASHWGEIAHFDGIAWTNATPRSITDTPLAMWGSTPSDIWGVGASGSIVHYDGAQWSSLNLSFFQQLHDVWGSGAGDIWAVGWFGTILHYDGATWTADPHGLTGSVLNGVWGSGPNDVWAVGDGGTVLRFDGSQWNTVTAPLTFPSVGGVWGSSASDVWFVGTEGGNGVVLHYDGQNWTDQTPSSALPSLNDVWGTGPTDLWVAGDGDMILHYDGNTWVNTAVGQNGYFQNVWGTGPDDVWATGGIGGCCPRWAASLFHYDGVAWTDVTPGTLTWRQMYALWGSRSGPLWAWGSLGTRLVGSR